jgi:hypothetical protein
MYWTVGSGVGEAYEDISTIVLNILQAEIGTAPPQKRARKQDAPQLLFLSCLEAGTQVSLVTMSCLSQRSAAPPLCLPLGIKDLLKEDERLLDDGRLFDKGRHFG